MLNRSICGLVQYARFSACNAPSLPIPPSKLTNTCSEIENDIDPDRATTKLEVEKKKKKEINKIHKMLVL